VLAGQPGGQRHLIGEVQRALAALALPVGPHQRQQGDPEPLRGNDLAQVDRQLRALPRPARRRLDHRAELFGVLAQLLLVDHVLGQLAGQRQQVPRHGDRHPLGVQVLRPGGHDPVGELPAGGLGE